MLTQERVRELTAPGRYLDHKGLYLVVEAPDQRRWEYRYQRRGREHRMSLGPVGVVTLAGARARHLKLRQQLLDGLDPLAERKREQAPKVAHTFAEVAKLCIDAHEAGWRNKVHREQWRSSLQSYAVPVLGDKPVDAIEVNDILAVVQPIWAAKTETASRVRARIEAVLNYAAARGWRSGPNPASWKGNLQLLLPPPVKLKKGGHHAALPWREAPKFMAELRGHGGMGAWALWFAVLTAARSGEVRGAAWEEIDLDAAVWTLPGERMKSGRPHRVPLSDAALATLRGLAKIRTGRLVFFSRSGDDVPLSDITLLAVLKRMGLRGKVTTHGFRSTFRDWCADNNQPHDLAESALAHANGNGTIQAYLRTDMLEQRRGLMQAWSDYLLG